MGRIGANARKRLAVAADPGIDAAARWLLPRAEQHFAEAARLLATRPRGLLLAPRLMESAYARVLRKLAAQGWHAPRRRVRVNKPLLLLDLVRHRLLA